MKKIISLFQRNYDGDRLVRDEVTPGAEWVVNGEGVATQKFDGTCCLIKDRELFKRYDAKRGKHPPKDFIPAQDPDPVTGHWPGWVPVVKDNPSDKWHVEALELSGLESTGHFLKDGTYELCGPNVQGNPEGFKRHILIRHGLVHVDAPRDFNGLKQWIQGMNIEGVVWHHPDGRMVKIKKKDFGFQR